MHTESDIRKAIKPLLDKYGQLTISEVKTHLCEVLEFDEDDKKLSSTRREMLILQRIGNIVAHQNTSIKEYKEGFIVDKTIKPAVFTAIIGLSGNLKPISNHIIEFRRYNSRVFKGKHINWRNINNSKKKLGDLGENFVYEFERNKVANFSKNDVDRVMHLSKIQGDGLGYDISSIDEDGNILKIEVKTTIGAEDSDFYISNNELEFLKMYMNDGACIYRVFNFNPNTKTGDIKVITFHDLMKTYNLDPINFVVSKKIKQ